VNHLQGGKIFLLQISPFLYRFYASLSPLNTTECHPGEAINHFSNITPEEA
jgi:hypothetical protein